MPRFSIGRRLSRRWPLLVAVVVVALASFAVYRLHGIFVSQDVTSTPSGSENDIVPFNPNMCSWRSSARRARWQPSPTST